MVKNIKCSIFFYFIINLKEPEEIEQNLEEQDLDVDVIADNELTDNERAILQNINNEDDSLPSNQLQDKDILVSHISKNLALSNLNAGKKRKQLKHLLFQLGMALYLYLSQSKVVKVKVYLYLYL